MAKITQMIITLTLMIHILITIAIAGREIPNVNIKKNDDVKHPDTLITRDRGYVVPGIGRGIRPKFMSGYNPFTYNPVTGENDGGILGGRRLPTFGGVIGGRRRYVPGGDDTFVPNPGSLVPIPGSGSAAPGPASD